MALSVFDDRSHPPSTTSVQQALGRCAHLWSALVEKVRMLGGDIEQEWTFAGRNYGWSMRLKRKDRNLVDPTPCDGHFLVGVVLGEKAIAAARAAGAAAGVLALVEAAPSTSRVEACD